MKERDDINHTDNSDNTAPIMGGQQALPKRKATIRKPDVSQPKARNVKSPENSIKSPRSKK